MTQTISFDSSAALAKWILNNLPLKERQKLIQLIQKEEEPTETDILDDIKLALQDQKLGKLKTRPATDFLDEL